MLSEETVNDIKKLISQYPYPRAAMLPALSLAQKEKGYIGDDVMVELANILNVPISSVKSVVYFYDLYRHRPGGRHIIRICTNIPCMIGGVNSIIEYLEKTYALSIGGTSEDGMFSLLEAECIGSCDHPPAMLIDDKLFEGLTIDKIGSILNSYR